jgi:putative redox protein
MTIKQATVTLADDALRFVGRTGSGHQVILDGEAGDTGPRPAELIPLALAGCTAMDVISILRKKRQDVRRYEVRASGTQRDEHPAMFTRIDVVHEVDGGVDLDTEAVRRAIELSATRYCSVGSTLMTGVTEIHHGYAICRGTSEPETGEVVVIGPEGYVLPTSPGAPGEPAPAPDAPATEPVSV